MAPLKWLAISGNSIVRRTLFGSPRFARIAFGVDVAAPAYPHSYCEWGTIAQRFVLRHYAPRARSLLEIGTGAHAVISIFARKHWPHLDVLATDILPHRVERARETSVRNHVTVRFAVADMFDGIAGRFDLILFNPPAIPTRELEETGHAWEEVPGLGARCSWSADGGVDGLREIRKFLSGLRASLEPGGRALLSVNPVHCRRARLDPFIVESGLDVDRKYRLFGINDTYVLQVR